MLASVGILLNIAVNHAAESSATTADRRRGDGRPRAARTRGGRVAAKPRRVRHARRSADSVEERLARSAGLEFDAFTVEGLQRHVSVDLLRALPAMRRRRPPASGFSGAAGPMPSSARAATSEDRWSRRRASCGSPRRSWRRMPSSVSRTVSPCRSRSGSFAPFHSKAARGRSTRSSAVLSRRARARPTGLRRERYSIFPPTARPCSSSGGARARRR